MNRDGNFCQQAIWRKGEQTQGLSLFWECWVFLCYFAFFVFLQPFCIAFLDEPKAWQSKRVGHRDTTECIERRNRINKGHVSAEDVCAMRRKIISFLGMKSCSMDWWRSMAEHKLGKGWIAVPHDCKWNREKIISRRLFLGTKIQSKTHLCRERKEPYMQRRKWKRMISILDLAQRDNEILWMFPWEKAFTHQSLEIPHVFIY